MDRRQLLKILGLGFLLPVPKLDAGIELGHSVWNRQLTKQVGQWYKLNTPLTEDAFIDILQKHRSPMGTLKPNVAEMNALALEDLVGSIYPNRTYIVRPINTFKPTFFYYPGGRIELKVLLEPTAGGLSADKFYDRSCRHLYLRRADAIQ